MKCQTAEGIDLGVAGLDAVKKVLEAKYGPSQAKVQSRKDASGNDADYTSKWGKETEEEIVLKAEQARMARAKAGDVFVMAKWVLVYLSLMKVSQSAFVRLLKPVLGEGYAKLAFLSAFLTFIRFKFGPKRNIPRTDNFFELPLIGSAVTFGLNANRAHDFLLSMFRENKFQTTELAVMNVNMLFPMDARDREYVLRTNFKNYLKAREGDFGGIDYMMAEVLGRGIFAVDKKEWQDQRKIASHMFSGEALKTKMETTFNHHGDKFVDCLTQCAKKNQVVDIQDMFQSCIFDAFCEIAFGVELGTMEIVMSGKKSDFLIAFDKAQNVSSERMLALPIQWHLQRLLSLVIPYGKEYELREAVKIVVAQVEKIVIARKVDKDVDNKFDLLSLYISHAKKTNQTHMLENAYLIDTVINFMIAGRDTTSCTMTNVVNNLGTHPEVEEKLAKIMKEKVNSADITWDESRVLVPFAEAVFNETIRLAPPVGNDFRICIEEDVLPSGVKVNAGTRVFTPNAAIGRDPSLWTNPDDFVPERWMKLDEHGNALPVKRVDEYVLPVFFAGPRLCLGKDMAKFESIVFMNKIVRKLKLVPVPNQYPPGSDLYVMAPVIFFRNGLKVKVYEKSS